jgi:hypothetical protein
MNSYGFSPTSLNVLALMTSGWWARLAVEKFGSSVILMNDMCIAAFVPILLMLQGANEHAIFDNNPSLLERLRLKSRVDSKESRARDAEVYA